MGCCNPNLPSLRELDTEVTIQVPTRTPQDSVGGLPNSTWSTLETVFGKVRHASMRQADSTGRNELRVVTNVWVRYRTDLTSDLRLVINGITYEVHSWFDVDEEKRFIKILCERGAAS